MTATVPEQRTTIVQTGGDGIDVTAIGHPVRSATWMDAARLQCWLAGRGAMLVPAHAPFARTLAEDGPSEFRYWVKPQPQTARYAIHISIESHDAVEVSVNGEPAVRVTGARFLWSGVPPRPATIFYDRPTLSDDEEEIVIAVTGDTTIHSIAVEAVPRTSLSPADLGVDRLRFWARQPIMAPHLSAHVFGAQPALRRSARRAGLFQFSRGTQRPWSTTSATHTNLFVDGFSLLGRKLFRGDTVPGRTRVAFLVRSTLLAGGQIRIMRSGVPASTIEVTAGSSPLWQWRTTTLAHDVEDNESPNGYRGGVPDTFNITMARTGSTGTFQIASVSMLDIGA